MAIAVGGVGVGLWASFAATRYLSTFLFGVGRFDGLSYGVVGVVVIAVAAIACVVPARRAARVDPLVVLRSG
jgi:putative ABC transport system permease protein